MFVQLQATSDLGQGRLVAVSSSSRLNHLLSAVKNGHIKRITDPDIQSSVLEICGTNVSTNFITCPAEAKKTLGVKLPFLVMIIKNVRSFRPPSTFALLL